MRSILFAAIPAVMALTAVPVEGQVSARVHIDIPVGRQRTAYLPQRPALAVREYDPYRYGGWENYYDQWSPETVYLYDGRYYDYPIVEYAQPVVVYRYRNEIFFAPRQRGFDQWRQSYRSEQYYRPQYRAVPRDTRGQYDRDRYDGRDRNGYGGDRNGRDDHRQSQPVPQRGNGDGNRASVDQGHRSGQPAGHDGRNGSSGNRSRPRP